MSGCFSDDEIDVIIEDVSGVDGHAGRVAFLRRPKSTALLALGRRHLYEGYDAREVTELVGAARNFSLENLVVTNAAGGLDPTFKVGEIMAIDDCIGSLMPMGNAWQKPLNGWEGGAHGRGSSRPLFDRDATDAVVDLAAAEHIALRRGVYAGVQGPSYETRAEIRMLRRMGASAVGMSTVPEAREAARLGIRTIGFSLITNTATEAVSSPLDHSDVVAEGANARQKMRAVIEIALRVLRGTDHDKREEIGGNDNIPI